MNRRNLLLLLLALVVFLPARALARECYAHPTTGAGTACTQTPGAPCTLPVALTECATAGDTIWLEDGTYIPASTGGFLVDADGTIANRITIDAVNPWQAIVTDNAYSIPLQACNGPNDSFGQIMNIYGDYITVRNLAVDGCEQSWDSLRVRGNGGDPNPQSVGVILENLRLTDLGRACFGAFNTDGLIIRNNHCLRTGYQGPGEGFYLSSASGSSPVANVEIYGNIIESNTNNFVDFKESATNSDLHHNMSVDLRLRTGRETIPLQGADDGIVRSEGPNLTSGNVVRDSIFIGANSSYSIRGNNARIDVLNNVWMDVVPAEWVDERTLPAATIIGGNVLYNTSGTINAPVVQTPANVFGATLVAARAEVDRILQEMHDTGLGLMGGLTHPTIASCEATDASTIITRWASPTFPLSVTDNGQFVVVGSINGAQTEGATVVQGTLETATTLTASSLDATDVITVDTGYDAVRMDTNFSGEIDLRSQANGAPVTCTNSIGGAPSVTITQSNCRWVKADNDQTIDSTGWFGEAVRGLNTDITLPAGGQVVLACNLEVTVGAAPTQGYRLKWDTTSGGAFANNIPAQGACGGANTICAADHPLSTSGTNANTSVILDDDGGLANVTGKLVDISGGIPSLVLSQDEEVDMRWSVQAADDASVNDTACVRMHTDSGTALTYTNPAPCFTIRPTRSGAAF